MTITLQLIASANWIECIELAPTAEQQRIGFVEPNRGSLAQAYAERWWQPYAIYADETMIGFVMYGRWPEMGIPAHHDGAKPGIDFILRFMIDERYQGRGYGHAAMAVLIAQIKTQPNGKAIEITYDVSNAVMAHLCTRAGFQPTGHIIEGEIEARLTLL